MKPSDAKTWLRWMMAIRKPAILIGKPGVGKTSLWYQAAQDLNMDAIETRLGLSESVDLRGMPVTDLKTGVTRWLRPAEFPKAGCKPTLWLFDEWLQGTTSVQCVAGQALIPPRRIGEYEVPENVYIGAASNRYQDRAGTNKMPTHIADRFAWGEVEEDIDDWCAWAIANGIEPHLIAFLRWRPELLSKFEPNKNVQPSPFL